MWSGFHAKNLNTGRELELAANRAEPESQAELVPGPDPKEMFKNFFKKIKSSTMPYVREKGCLTFFSNRGTPCSYCYLWPYQLNSSVGKVHIEADWIVGMRGIIAWFKKIFMPGQDEGADTIACKNRSSRPSSNFKLSIIAKPKERSLTLTCGE